MPPKKKSRKPKVEPEVEDYLNKLTGVQLQQELQLQQDKLNEVRTKRNYIQMDRDMVEQFYQNTCKEIEECKIRILAKETEAEQLEEDHRVEVKVYLQKVKHIEYEKEKSNEEIKEDGENAKKDEVDYFEKGLKRMKEEKDKLKRDLQENERSYIMKVEEKQLENDKKLEKEKRDFDIKIQELTSKYEDRLKKLEEDLKLKLKVEIHELEERKNQHINELLRNHDKAFAELKTYYKDITSENLNLIKGQKEEIAKIHKNIQKNSKKLSSMKEKNNSLRKPLEEARAQRDNLKELLKQFSKHKMSLSNLKSKQATLREKILRLQSNQAQLEEVDTKVRKDKENLEEKFEDITKEVKQNAELQNKILEDKLQTAINQQIAKETQLKQILEQAQLDPSIYQQLVQKIQISIESKNTLSKNLKYSIHHATKAYNDAIRVYESKLVEFGIPKEELGFQPLETITSTMPAGLVSS